MRDFKNLFNIIFKRFGIWILLLSLLISTMNGMHTRGRLEDDSKRLMASVNEMAKDLDISFKAKQKISEAYLDEADDIAKNYAKKYNLKTSKELKELTEEEMDAYYQKIESKSSNVIWQKEGALRDYEVIRESNLYGVSSVGKYVENSSFGILILVVLIGFLITSLEQSLSYYEFTLMYPWKKKDEVWMKAIIVFILGLGIFLINLIMNIIMIYKSDFGLLFNVSSVLDPIIRSILYILASSILTVATGMIAGNFVGHGGLLIIAVGSIELIKYIIDIFINIFSPSLVDKSAEAFMNFKDKLPEILKPFISLFDVEANYPSIMGFIIVAILWAILAYLVKGKHSSERSGELVVSKPVAKVAKLIGTLSLTSLLYLVGSSTLMGARNMILELIIYALALLISIKLFDILFKVRLKF